MTPREPDRRAVLASVGVAITSTALPAAVAAASGTGGALAGSLRSLLSGPGQDAFDAAGDGDFVVVSASDYAAVVAGLDGATVLGLTDAELSTPMGINDRWAGYATTFPTEIGTVVAGATVVGYARRVHWSSTITSSLLLAPSYLGTYSRVGSTTEHGPTDDVVHLIRRGGAPESATRYLAMHGTTYTRNGVDGGRTSGNGLQYSIGGTADGASPPWYSFGSEVPVVQVLVHVP